MAKEIEGLKKALAVEGEAAADKAGGDTKPAAEGTDRSSPAKMTGAMSKGVSVAAKIMSA